MKLARLDECINSKDLERSCRQQGLIEPLRFPKKWRGKKIKDPLVLREILGDGTALFTVDDTMVEQHRQHIPNQHPGIIIAAQERPAIEKMLTLPDSMSGL